MLQIINPATELIIQELKTDTPLSLAEKYQESREYQPQWAATPYSQRKEAIARFRELIIAKMPELAQQLTSEMGKPLNQANNELQALLARLDFFLEHTESVLQEETVWTQNGMTEKMTWEPLGVIANISAWNYPYFVGSNVFLPALLTGNTVLYKPSEYTPLTGLSIAQLLHEAGIPEPAFQTIIGKGNIGQELLKLPLDGIFFTGSHATGVKIAETVSHRLCKIQLELGGKDPAYVCDDVDLASAVASLADGAFYNNGQSCCAVERIYVHASVYEAFVKDFVKTVKDFKVGDPLEKDTYIGPLARQEQLEYLEHQVTDARHQGATLLQGGKRRQRPGYYFEPTVLVDVTHQMQVMKEESFGPLIGIQRVDSDEEALALMNDTEYGLTAGVYTASKERAVSILSRLNAGSVYWNCCDRVSPRLPWTGRKHSGLGSTLSRLGIQTFLQPKAWHLKEC